MNTISSTSKAFANAFSVSKEDLPWLSELKKIGMDRFSEVGLPAPGNEAWKYTSLNSLSRVDWTEAPAEYDVGELPWLSEGGAYRLVLVNGSFDSKLSNIGELPDGAFIGSFTEALSSHVEMMESYLCTIASSEDSPLLALNAAQMADGYVILLKDVQLTRPIEILNIGLSKGKAIAFHPRNLIIVDQQSEGTIIEHLSGADEGAYFANIATEIVVDNESNLKHHRLFADGHEAFGLISTGVKVGKDANYNSFVLSDSGKLLRNDVHIHLVSAGAGTKVGGIYMADDEQHVDHTILIEHEQALTKSEQIFKGALNGKARGVFQGNIKVHKGADGADGQLNNTTLLLAPGAEINCKPQLEIYADDVKCAHGFAAGELDEEELFYLRSRGIPHAEAKLILVEGFLSGVVNEFDLGEFEHVFRRRVTDWMRRG